MEFAQPEILLNRESIASNRIMSPNTEKGLTKQQRKNQKKKDRKKRKKAAMRGDNFSDQDSVHLFRESRKDADPKSPMVEKDEDEDPTLNGGRGPKIDKDVKLKIVDMGNGCWTYHHFSDEIQTR